MSHQRPACVGVSSCTPPSESASHSVVLHLLRPAGCPVCLDSRNEVVISPCRHALCLECALHLASTDDGQGGRAAVAPPLCPLCRGCIAEFQQQPAV